MSGADRKWIENLVTTITESWDNADKSRPRTMSFVGSEDYIRAQFEEYILALLSSVKYDNFLQKNATQDNVLPDIGPAPHFPSSLFFVGELRLTYVVEGVPVRDFGAVWVEQWRYTSNYAIWMSLTDSELFDIIEPRHPCSGTATLSLEDVQLRVQQTMQDLKLDEKMVASKEAISRTWVSGSSKVRGAVGSALAGIDQYRSQKKSMTTTTSEGKPTAFEGGSTKNEETVSSTGKETNGKKDSFVGSWSAWAAEKRKRAFQKEEPVKFERTEIGPAPLRPLAQWAKRNSDAEGLSLGGESVRSSGETRVEDKGRIDKGLD